MNKPNNIRSFQHIGDRLSQEDCLVVRTMPTQKALQTKHPEIWMREVMEELIRLTNTHPDANKTGCTATLAVVLPDQQVLIGHMGDSLALCIGERPNGLFCERITELHSVYQDRGFREKNPDYNPYEQLGRIWAEDEDYGVNITRVLGDTSIQVVYREPQITSKRFLPEDLLVLASDGLETLLSYPEGFRSECIIQPMSQWSENAAKYLADMAHLNRPNRCGDNVSVIALRFPVDQPVLLAVFDGHGGDTISKFAAKQLPLIADKFWPNTADIDPPTLNL